MKLLISLSLSRCLAKLCMVLLLSLLTHQSLAETRLRMVESNNAIESYAKGLLKLALSKIPDRNYVFQEDAPNPSEERIVNMLTENQIDVVWYATTNDLEERLLPIRICIYRGLLGYRLLMIKKGTQSKFNGINTLEDLKRISLGQGSFWADTNILTANNLNVVKAMKYDGLFYMLDGDRFDGFPRGIQEPWVEIQRYPKLSLDVEQTLLLAYKNPFYFFVNKSNTKLANDIERGLRIAIEDGSFSEYFFNNPIIKDALANANLKSRKIIHLQNPTLPPKTRVDEKALWFDPYAE